MREIRTYGSEGGEAGNGLPYPYPFGDRLNGKFHSLRALRYFFSVIR